MKVKVEIKNDWNKRSWTCAEGDKNEGSRDFSSLKRREIEKRE